MLSKGLSRVFSNTTVQKNQFFGTELSLQSYSHPYMTTGKTITLTRWTFVSKVMSLLFNMLSSLVIAFLLLILWLQSPSAMILEPKKIKSVTVSIVSPSICHKVISEVNKEVFGICTFYHHFNHCMPVSHIFQRLGLLLWFLATLFPYSSSIKRRGE